MSNLIAIEKRKFGLKEVVVNANINKSIFVSDNNITPMAIGDSKLSRFRIVFTFKTEISKEVLNEIGVAGFTQPKQTCLDSIYRGQKDFSFAHRKEADIQSRLTTWLEDGFLVGKVEFFTDAHYGRARSIDKRKVIDNEAKLRFFDIDLSVYASELLTIELNQYAERFNSKELNTISHLFTTQLVSFAENQLLNTPEWEQLASEEAELQTQLDAIKRKKGELRKATLMQSYENDKYPVAGYARDIFEKSLISPDVIENQSFFQS
ncbi:hypothetical protein LCS82_07605 [Vibrio harveyi]|uniref:hypothetical protein n=1 Tax=Vibrio harveyi TaxID=669 RepID=UPI002F5E4BF7